MEPPQKKSRPQVPFFNVSSAGESSQGVVAPAPSPDVSAEGGSPTKEAGKKLPAVPLFKTLSPSSASSSTGEAEKTRPDDDDTVRKRPLENEEDAQGPAAASRKNGSGRQDTSGAPPTIPGPTPRAPDCSGSNLQEDKTLQEKTDPGSLHKDLSMPAGVNQKGGVYGFDSDKKSGAGKAIALRLEPLKPGLPEYEKILGEHKQSILIGSQRGVVDVLVQDQAVSKKHTTLHLIGINGELAMSIVDTSTNGTYINGKRIPQKNKRFRLRNGDTLNVMDPAIDDEFGWKVDYGCTVAYFTRG